VCFLASWKKARLGSEARETKSARHPPRPEQPTINPGKHSRAGRFVRLKQGRAFVTVNDSGQPIHGVDSLETVLEDGMLRREQTLEEIRAMATR
jgi:hypothetical protein